MSRAPAPPPIASDGLIDPQAVARFRADLARLCDPDQPLLVAVSGGPDSVALLLLAHAALGARCVAATVDHGIRGEAAAEARFVGDLCAERGIEHTILAGALPERAGRTANLSARARTLRYRLLEAHAAALGAPRLATAHHAEDQVETMVMRLNRGAGVAGLAGVRAKGGRIVRPLLGWRRAELAALVAAAGIVPVDDPSNRDERYDRARLRAALVDTSWVDADMWRRSAEALGEAETALDWAAERLWREGAQRGGERSLTLTLTGPALPPAELLRRLLLRGLVQVDPGIEVRGPDLTRLVRRMFGKRLSAVARATLGGVLCTGHGGGDTWHVTFCPAPPRRSL